MNGETTATARRAEQVAAARERLRAHLAAEAGTGLERAEQRVAVAVVQAFLDRPAVRPDTD